MRVLKISVLVLMVLFLATGVSYAQTIKEYDKSKNSYYPDVEGWNRKALQNDEFQSFFPLTLKENLYLVSPTQEGVFESNESTVLDSAFIEYRNNASIKLGSKVFETLTARRSFYAVQKFEEMPVFKIWLEQVSQEEFPKYQEAVIGQLDSFKSSANIEKSTYKDHEYYLYLREDLTTEGLKGKNSIGGAYVFFPEENTAMYIFLFNTRYNSPNSYMITQEEVNSVIHQIIDSTTK